MTKREAARIAYKEGATQREIAKIFSITENTVSKWAKAENWKGKRVNFDMLKENSTQRVMELIDYQLRVIGKIKDKNLKMLEDLPEDKELQELLISKGDIDALQKLFTTIRSDQKKFSNYVRVVKEYLEWLSHLDLDLSKQVTESLTLFLNEKRKSL